VKVAPTSVNPVDWKHRRGFLKEMIPLRLPAILGHDVAGEVAEAGKDVTNFKPGDRVMGLINDSYAEFVTEKAANLARVPEGLDLEQAGVLPLVLLTGAQLIERGVQPHAGDTVLVTGALGGVGRSAVYTAKQRGARVVAGVRGKDRKNAESLGADRIVALGDVAADIASLEPVDAIADTVGGSMQSCFPGVLASVVLLPPDRERAGIRVVSVVVQAGQVHYPHRRTVPAERHRRGAPACRKRWHRQNPARPVTCLNVLHV
jgi:NADPH:quinone reductase-like Zn-dependent oxidoreductase